MTYAASLSDEEKKKLAETGQGVSTSGVVNSFTSPGGASAAVPAAKDPGTGYVNLQQYLDTNQGQGAALANTATAGATSSANNYLKNATETQTTAQSAIEAAKAANATAGSSAKSGIVQDPTKNEGAAVDFLGKGYGGPVASTYTTELASNLSGAQDAIASSTDANQQQANLQTAYGKRGDYTQGYGLLDNFLMRGDKSGQDVLSNVAGRGQELQTQYDTINSSLTDSEKQARDALETKKKEIRSTARDESGKLVTNLGNKAAVINAGADKSAEGFSEAGIGDVLATDGKAKTDLAALAKIQNMTPEEYAATFKVGQTKAGSPGSDPADGENSGGNGLSNTQKGVDALTGQLLGSQNKDAALQNVLSTTEKIGNAVDQAKAAGSRPGELWDSLVNLRTGLSTDKLVQIYDAAIKHPLGDIRKLSDNLVREGLQSIDNAVAGYDRTMNGLPDGVFKESIRLGGQPIRNVLTQAAPVAREIASNANELVDNTGKTITKASKDVKSFGKKAFPKLKSQASIKAADDTKNAAKKAADDAKSAASKAAGDVKNVVKKASVPELKKLAKKIKF